MISLAPSLEPALQVKIGQSSETRDLAHALASRAMAGETCHNIGFRDSLKVDRLSPFRESPTSIMGGFRRQRCKIIRQISHRVGLKIRRGSPHVLFRKRIVADVSSIAAKLGLDVKGPLSGQSRRGGITLRSGSMAPCAITDAGRHRTARP